MQIHIDDLFPVAETLQMLRFAEVAGGEIRLTADGKRFVDATTDERGEPVRTAWLRGS